MTIATTEQPTALIAAGSTGANLIREAAAVMATAHSLAKAVCNTKMVPKHFQGNADECAAAMLYGASLGMDPMQSVRQIYVVHGQAALYARAMDALVKGAGHNTWTVTTADASVTVAGQRKGSPHVEESTWTYERAQKAGYTNNEKYRTDPQAMLYSKALSEVCRKIAPDVLNGVYAVEELQMERWDGTTATPRQTSTGADRMRGMLGQTTAEQIPEPSGAEEAPGNEGGATPAGSERQATSAPESPLLDTGSDLAKAMYAGIHEAGIEEADRLPWLSNVIDREIASSKEMTDAEARQVLDFLNAEKSDA